jgi:hypothetical protein
LHGKDDVRVRNQRFGRFRKGRVTIRAVIESRCGPAPLSNTAEAPRRSSRCTTEGTMETRFSPGFVSFRTAILIGISGSIACHPHHHGAAHALRMGLLAQCALIQINV